LESQKAKYNTGRNLGYKLAKKGLKSSKEYEDIHIIRDTWMSREQISDFNPFGSKKSHTWNKDKDFKRHNLSY